MLPGSTSELDTRSSPSPLVRWPDWIKNRLGLVNSIKMEQAVAAVNYLRDLVGIDHIHIASDEWHDNKILDNWGAGNVDTGTGKTAKDLYPVGGWVYDRCKFALEKGIPTDAWEPAKTWPARRIRLRSLFTSRSHSPLSSLAVMPPRPGLPDRLDMRIVRKLPVSRDEGGV